jgi:uncharacterized protein (UPF0276 family)
MKPTNSQLGVSLRSEWIPYWDTLGLGQFSKFELTLPLLSETHRFESKIANTPIHIHLNDTSIFDPAAQFSDKLAAIKAVQNLNIKSISLHYCYENLESGKKLPGMFPPVRYEDQINVACQNVQELRSCLKHTKISIENLSTPFDSELSRSVHEQFLEVASSLELSILLDVTNLANSCHNSGMSLGSALQEMLEFKIDYCHYGGFFETEGIRLDSHDGFFKDSTVTKGANSLLAREYSLIYEQDFRLNDIEYCRTQLNLFKDTFENLPQQI